MRLFKFSLVLALVLVFGVGLVSADEDTLRDGRVNYWESGAPVAVYCQFDRSDPANNVFNGIELLKINGSNQGEPLLEVSATDINAVGDQPSANTLLAEARGYKLYRVTSGHFAVMSPPDAEGKVYSFTWKRGDLGC